MKSAGLQWRVNQLRGDRGMLKPLDGCRRDSTLFQFTARRLRGFFDADHPLICID